MKSIAITKPDIAVLASDKLDLSLFGLLSLAFEKEIRNRSSWQTGFYPELSLDLLQQDIESDPENVSQTTPLDIRLHFVLDMLSKKEFRQSKKKSHEHGKTAERIIERIYLLERQIVERAQSSSAAHKNISLQSLTQSKENAPTGQSAYTQALRKWELFANIAQPVRAFSMPWNSSTILRQALENVFISPARSSPLPFRFFYQNLNLNQKFNHIQKENQNQKNATNFSQQALLTLRQASADGSISSARASSPFFGVPYLNQGQKSGANFSQQALLTLRQAPADGSISSARASPPFFGVPYLNQSQKSGANFSQQSLFALRQIPANGSISSAWLSSSLLLGSPYENLSQRNATNFSQQSLFTLQQAPADYSISPARQSNRNISVTATTSFVPLNKKDYIDSIRSSSKKISSISDFRSRQKKSYIGSASVTTAQPDKLSAIQSAIPTSYTSLQLVSWVTAAPAAEGWTPHWQEEHPGFPIKPSEPPAIGVSILLPDSLRQRRIKLLEQQKENSQNDLYFLQDTIVDSVNPAFRTINTNTPVQQMLAQFKRNTEETIHRTQQKQNVRDGGTYQPYNNEVSLPSVIPSAPDVELFLPLTKNHPVTESETTTLHSILPQQNLSAFTQQTQTINAEKDIATSRQNEIPDTAKNIATPRENVASSTKKDISVSQQSTSDGAKVPAHEDMTESEPSRSAIALPVQQETDTSNTTEELVYRSSPVDDESTTKTSTKTQSQTVIPSRQMQSVNPEKDIATPRENVASSAKKDISVSQQSIPVSEKISVHEDIMGSEPSRSAIALPMQQETDTSNSTEELVYRSSPVDGETTMETSTTTQPQTVTSSRQAQSVNAEKDIATPRENVASNTTKEFSVSQQSMSDGAKVPAHENITESEPSRSAVALPVQQETATSNTTEELVYRFSPVDDESTTETSTTTQPQNVTPSRQAQSVNAEKDIITPRENVASSTKKDIPVSQQSIPVSEKVSAHENITESESSRSAIALLMQQETDTPNTAEELVYRSSPVDDESTTKTSTTTQSQTVTPSRQTQSVNAEKDIATSRQNEIPDTAKNISTPQQKVASNAEKNISVSQQSISVSEKVSAHEDMTESEPSRSAIALPAQQETDTSNTTEELVYRFSPVDDEATTETSTTTQPQNVTPSRQTQSVNAEKDIATPQENVASSAKKDIPVSQQSIPNSEKVVFHEDMTESEPSRSAVALPMQQETATSNTTEELVYRSSPVDDEATVETSTTTQPQNVTPSRQTQSVNAEKDILTSRENVASDTTKEFSVSKQSIPNSEKVVFREDMTESEPSRSVIALPMQQETATSNTTEELVYRSSPVDDESTTETSTTTQPQNVTPSRQTQSVNAEKDIATSRENVASSAKKDIPVSQQSTSDGAKVPAHENITESESSHSVIALPVQQETAISNTIEELVYRSSPVDGEATTETSTTTQPQNVTPSRQTQSVNAEKDIATSRENVASSAKKDISVSQQSIPVSEKIVFHENMTESEPSRSAVALPMQQETDTSNITEELVYRSTTPDNKGTEREKTSPKTLSPSAYQTVLRNIAATHHIFTPFMSMPRTGAVTLNQDHNYSIEAISRRSKNASHTSNVPAIAEMVSYAASTFSNSDASVSTEELTYLPVQTARQASLSSSATAPSQPNNGISLQLPDWAKRFVPTSNPTESHQDMQKRFSASQNITSSRQIEWTAPSTVPSQTSLVFHESPLKKEKSTASTPPSQLSESEIRRAADQIYRRIEERLRKELRRSGR